MALIDIQETAAPDWGTEMWRVSGASGPLFLFGYTQLDLLSNEIYLFLMMEREPKISELKTMRPLFWKWAAGSRAIIVADGVKNERFAEFFGFEFEGTHTPQGKIYVGDF